MKAGATVRTAMLLGAEGVRRLAAHEYIDPHEIRRFQADELVVKGGVSSRLGFELVVKVYDEFCKREFIHQPDPVRGEIVHGNIGPPLVLAELHHFPDILRGDEKGNFDDRFPDFLDVPDFREIRGPVGLDDLTVLRDHFIDHVGGGGHEFHPELPTEPFL